MTRDRLLAAVMAVPALMLLALLGVQERAQRDIDDNALGTDLERGRAVIERLLDREREALGRTAALALTAPRGPARGGARTAQVADLARRLVFSGQAADLVAAVDGHGRVLAAVVRQGTAPAAAQVLDAEAGLDLVDGVPYLLIAVSTDADHVVVGRAIDTAWLRGLGIAAGVELALVGETGRGLSQCFVSTLPCAAALAPSTAPVNGASWRRRVDRTDYRAIRRSGAGGGLELVVARVDAGGDAGFASLRRTSFALVAIGVTCAAAGIFGLLLAERRRRAAQGGRDDLTGLADRGRLNRELGEQCARAARHGLPCAVLVMDLDRFKVVNDTLGHDAGDAVLHEVGERLRGAVRATDLVARPGGDEFVIVAPGVDAATVDLVARKIAAALERPLKVGASTVDVGASIGIALLPEDAGSPRDLLRLGETAMYSAKRRHLGALRWSAECETSNAAELSLLGELRAALEQGQFELHFQPLVELPSRRAVAAEALLRWRHPERGLVAPQEFIPFAEATGYMRTLTRWILARALEAAADLAAAGFELRMGVNVTPQDLADHTFTEYVRGLLARHGLSPRALCLELTETAFMDNPTKVVDVMLALRRMGVALAVDDFGTGYASLAYVRELPVTEIKIDRSFTAELRGNGQGRSIVAAAIDLGRRLNLGVVAEGVEDEATLALLESHGCSLVQGFHICRPLAEDAFLLWVAGRGYGGAAQPTLALAASA
ncbi:MAG: putative bifunctional diguanylate cyclase/phosphodiesterase [Gammaproteobacteria bacterium]